MNLFILEDDANAMSIVNYLKGLGHTVTHALNISDMVYRFEWEQAFNSFDAFLFDVSVPGETIYHKDGQVISYGQNGYFSGLEFIFGYKYYEQLKTSNKKIAIITAHTNEMMRDRAGENIKLITVGETEAGSHIIAKEGDDFKIPVIGKASDTMINQLNNFLRGKE